MNILIRSYFIKYSHSFLTNLDFMIKSMLRSGSCNTSEVARGMHHETHESFKANDMRIYRFLQNKEFQIDDKLWRCYSQILFDAMEERGLIKAGDQLSLKVDYTTSLDYFLILSASIDFNGRSVPIISQCVSIQSALVKWIKKRWKKLFSRD